MTDIVTPTPITAHGTAMPDASDEATFDLRAFALFSYLVNTLTPGANTLAQHTYQNALAAMENAEAAKAAANFAGDWVDLTGALSMPASVYHASRFWALRTDLADVTASTPSDASPDWVAIGPIDAAGLSFDNSGTGLVASNVQDAVVEVMEKGSQVRNLFHNAELLSVFRNDGGMVPTTVGSGQFLIDRWTSYLGTLTRSAPAFTPGTVEWTSGVLHQRVIDIGTIQAGDKVTFAWDGTAVIRVNGALDPNWYTSPFTYTHPGPGGSELSVEFGLAGGAPSATLTKPRAYHGEVDKGFYPLPLYELEPILDRYCRYVSILHQVVATAGSQQTIWTESHGRMAQVATPTLVGSASNINVSALSFTAGTTDRFYVAMASTAAGNTRVTAKIKLDTGI